MKLSKVVRLCISLFFFYNSLCAFKLGIENISDDFLYSLSSDKSLKYRVGLVTNQTGCDQKGNRTLDILLAKKLKINYIITSEHGFSGTVAANKRVGDEVDKKTKIPIYSLYKEGKLGTVSPQVMANIDVFFFDMQDSGMRHYTKITALHTILRLAATYNKKVVVLDRPNPLGPNMEGTLVDPLLISSISIAPIPIRHGMTIGEIAWYFNKHVLEQPADLHVVKMDNYSRNMKMKELLVALSPNVHCLDSCLGYSFLGIIGDIRPFDVGVETDLSFQCITLPDSIVSSKCNWNELRSIFAQYGVHSVAYSYINERKKSPYSGLRLQVADINELSSFELLLDIIDFFKKYGIQFTFSPSFDKAAGTQLLRKFCMGTCPRLKLVRNVNAGLDRFIKKAQDSFMYLPEPSVVKLK